MVIVNFLVIGWSCSFFDYIKFFYIGGLIKCGVNFVYVVDLFLLGSWSDCGNFGWKLFCSFTIVKYLFFFVSLLIFVDYCWGIL